MGYAKVIQYGDRTEIRQYQKALYRKPPDPLRATILASVTRMGKERDPTTVSGALARIQEIKQLIKEPIKRTPQKIITHRSFLRTKQNFFRLCHLNVVTSQSVVFMTVTFNYDIEQKKAARRIEEFYKRLQKNTKSGKKLSYISVAEKTKKNRIHYHFLLFNLSSEEIKNERTTRNIQRQFNGGFVDICPTSNRSEKIARYMAKYMAKSFRDSKIEKRRNYNCSRNIIKPTETGSNEITNYLDLILPVENSISYESHYDVPYLGKCVKKIYKHQNIFKNDCKN